MFPRHLRLRREWEVNRIFKSGARCSCQTFSLIYKKNQYGSTRITVIAGNKIGNAVTRNLIKRRFRAIFRGVLPSLRGHDLVVQIRNEAVNAEYKKLVSDVSWVVSKVLITLSGGRQ